MRNRFMLSPSALDEAVPGLEALAQSDWWLNKPVLPDGDKQTRMSAIYRPIADFVAESLARGERPVSIAGDCCAAIGVLAGLQRAGLNPTVIWFDAHGDFNTWETTPGGFIGGMPLAMMVGRGEQTIVDAVGLTPIAEKQVILTDARALDPKEQELVKQSTVRHLPDPTSLLTYAFPNNPLFIHFDPDIIQTSEVPAMDYPAPGGVSARELQKVFRHVAQTGKIAAISLASWNPEKDQNGQSQKVCLALLQILIDNY